VSVADVPAAQPGGARSDDRYNHEDPEVTFYEESEARRGVSTSEFWIYLLSSVTLLFFTYDNGRDSLSRDDGWRYVCFLTVAYLVSRGLAKAGSSEPRLRRREL
jgi:hypothetical protein